MAATSTASFGGAGCIIKAFTGSGMDTLWTSPAAGSVAVEVTAGGSKPYSFIVCKDGSDLGYICYDTNDRLASFATISTAAGASCTDSGNIVCK